MATLEIEDYPPLAPEYLAPQPANGERGPDHIDADTMRAVHAWVEEGMLTLAPQWEAPLATASDARLAELFAERLHTAGLSEYAPVLHHRRQALAYAIQALAEEAIMAQPGFAIGRELPVIIGDLEAFMRVIADGRDHWLAGLSEQQIEVLLDAEFLLKPLQVSKLLSVSEGQLANWRNFEQGPPWLRVGSRSIRYPAAGVRAFIIQELSR